MRPLFTSSSGKPCVPRGLAPVALALALGFATAGGAETPRASAAPSPPDTLFSSRSRPLFRSVSSAPVSTVVVRRVAGDVRSSGEDGALVTVQVGDLPASGRRFVTGPDGALTLRVHPEMSVVDVPPRSRAAIHFEDADTGASRRVTVGKGRVLARPGAGTTLVVEDPHARAEVRVGRVAYASGAGEATVIALEGEARVVNRATGAVDVVSRGGKAVAGPRGTIVSRADARELAEAGLRQNVLEVDFWNPATGEYRTLELEYEARPGAP